MLKQIAVKLGVRLAVLVMAFGLAGAANATMYVYRGPSGEKMVTNVPLNRNGYDLLFQRDSVDNLGNLAAGRKGPADYSSLPHIIAIGHSGTPRGKFVDRNTYDEYIRDTAHRYGVEPALVKAVIQVESNFNPVAESRVGARGLMQLMPGTAARYSLGGHQLFNPWQNIEAGVQHLAYLKTLFPNNVDYVLAAYNAGENNVVRYSGIPPFPETLDYVQKVKYSHNIFKRVFF
jgi:hypothetical protein